MPKIQLSQPRDTRGTPHGNSRAVGEVGALPSRGREGCLEQAMDLDSLTVTVLVPENAVSPIVVFDDNAALKAAIVEHGAARHLTDEWDVAGFYILVDRCDADGGWGVYVGKAPSGIRDRIKSHLRNKDTWYRALLVRRDTTHGFNSAQIGWLEGRLWGPIAKHAYLDPLSRWINQHAVAVSARRGSRHLQPQIARA